MHKDGASLVIWHALRTPRLKKDMEVWVCCSPWKACGDKSVVGLLLPLSKHRIICLQVLRHRITELQKLVEEKGLE
jgi:hypothetical protein